MAQPRPGSLCLLSQAPVRFSYHPRGGLFLKHISHEGFAPFKALLQFHSSPASPTSPLPKALPSGHRTRYASLSLFVLPSSWNAFPALTTGHSPYSPHNTHPKWPLACAVLPACPRGLPFLLGFPAPAVRTSIPALVTQCWCHRLTCHVVH